MRIALDAMGSDNAPDVEIEGAVLAAMNTSNQILLVGDESILKPRLEAHKKISDTISVVHASQSIGMHESPVMAVRRKKDASLCVAMRMMKNGEVDAVISAGNTGAVMVCARTMLGSIKGVARPALCQVLPTRAGHVVLLDLGANVDCTARQLCEFAEMGIAYSKFTLGVESPKVGLLNIGEEDLKGSHVAKEVHRNLKAACHVNFIGNVEPKAMFNGTADVVVCDGFVGNLILKTSEAVASLVSGLLRDQFESSTKNKLAAMIARKSLHELKQKVDPNETHGAPLLGIDGHVVVLHGSSNAQGVANAIFGTQIALENNLIEHIRENITALRDVERQVEVTTLPKVAENL